MTNCSVLSERCARIVFSCGVRILGGSFCCVVSVDLLRICRCGAAGLRMAVLRRMVLMRGLSKQALIFCLSSGVRSSSSLAHAGCVVVKIRVSPSIFSMTTRSFKLPMISSHCLKSVNFQWCSAGMSE